MTQEVTKLRQTTESAEAQSANPPPIAGVPAFIAVRKRIDDLQQRREISDRRFAIAKAQAHGQKSTTPVDEQADRLLSGGRVAAIHQPSAMDAITREREILTTTIFSATERLEEVRGELSFAVCSRYRKEHDENLRAALAAATALFDALERNRILRGRIQGAGYQLLSGAMPVHVFPTATLLGNPRISSSHAGQFRNWLEENGIV